MCLGFFEASIHFEYSSVWIIGFLYCEFISVRLLENPGGAEELFIFLY